MQSVVLEIIEHERCCINGQGWDKYQFKLKDEDYIYSTIGFRPLSNDAITLGDIIENMRVVGRLTGEELCKAFYEARAIEDGQNEVVKQARSKKITEAKIIPVISKKQSDIEEKKWLKLEQISLF